MAAGLGSGASPHGPGAASQLDRAGPHPGILALAEAAVQMLEASAAGTSVVVVQRETGAWRVLAGSADGPGVTPGGIVRVGDHPWVRRIVDALAPHPSVADEADGLDTLDDPDDEIRTAVVAPVTLSDGILVGAVAILDHRPLSSDATAASTLVAAVSHFLAAAYEIVWDRGEAEAVEGLAEDTAERQHRLLTSVAHDLRTPLAVISGMADVVLRHPGDEERNTVAAGAIAANARRLVTMVDGLIDAESRAFSELEEELVDLDLAEFLEDVAAEAEHLISRPDVRLEWDASGVVTAPPLALRRLLLNLLANAIRVTRAGTVRLAAVPDGDHFVLSVTDTGRGMSSDELTGMKQAYRRGEDSVGFGLGLTIVHRLAEMLGAELDVTSVEGEGTTFRLRLPRSVSDPSQGSR